jgi:hypothetical protein
MAAVSRRTFLGATAASVAAIARGADPADPQAARLEAVDVAAAAAARLGQYPGRVSGAFTFWGSVQCFSRFLSRMK